MNQPNLPVMAPKTAQVTENQDVLAMVRRYIWLLVAGAIAGGVASGGAFTYSLRYHSRFTARIPFQVNLPSPPLGLTNSLVYTPTDDTAQVIHRQEFIFDQDAFLEMVLQSDEFHKNKDTDAPPAWYVDNKGNLLKALRRDLGIAPRINAAAFDVTMTTHNPGESVNLVVAVSKVYREFLNQDSNRRKSVNLKNLSDALKKAEKDFQIATDSLSDFEKRKSIDVQRSRFEIEKAALQGLNDSFMRADAMATGAEQQFDGFKKMSGAVKTANEGIDAQRLKIENAIHELQSQRLDLLKQMADERTKPSPSANAVIKLQSRLDENDAQYTAARNSLKDSSVARQEVNLTPDMQQQLENDPTVRQLLFQRLGLEQDIFVEQIGKINPNLQVIKILQTRIDQVDMQLASTRAKLKDDFIKRMEDIYANEAVNQRALAGYIGKNRQEKEELVKSLGHDLMEYQQRVEDLKERQSLFNSIRNQYALAEASMGTDDVRVQQIIDIPTKPSNPSWPQWYMFVPMGTLAGLGLSAVLAYLLMLTDTRVRTPRDISKTLQLPLLGFVPDESDDRMLTGDVESAILTSPASMVAESFRQIRSHITAQTAHNPASTLLIASVTPGGGATTVAANFAAAMALNDLRVLLIDSNFYRPSFDRLFKDMPAEGLTDAIAHPENAAASIVPHPSLPTMHLMGAGSQLAGASSEIFEGKSFRELLEQLKTKYDLIIFDGAPLNLVSDSLALGARVDGVVSVVRAGEVSRGAVTRVRDHLRGVHANLLGFVLNAAQTSNTGYFKEHYRDFYRYAGKNPRRALGE